jgi:hypothetical protein
MRYMRGLNEWLERDVHDRQAELLGVSARVDQLRTDLSRLGMGIQAPGAFSILCRISLCHLIHENQLSLLANLVHHSLCQVCSNILPGLCLKL